MTFECRVVNRERPQSPCAVIALIAPPAPKSLKSVEFQNIGKRFVRRRPQNSAGPGQSVLEIAGIGDVL
jgi:hypothetical protein